MRVEERARRRAICETCQHKKLTYILKVPVERCGVCGCTLRGRILTGCPVKRF